MKNSIKRFLSNNNSIWLFWILFILALILASYGGYLSKLKNTARIENKFNFGPLTEAIDASSYLVGVINTNQILLSRNQDLHFYPASLSKLMTAVIALDNIPLSQEIKISSYAVSTEGEEGNLKTGETFTSQDLLKILLISSSNDAAVALSEYLDSQGQDFVDLMNAKAKQLQMSNTAFFGPTGIDRKGNFTTVEDLFKLSQAIYYHYPLLGEIARKAEEIVISNDGQTIHHLINTNSLTRQLSYLWLGKTGSTPDARDCLLTIFEFPFQNDKISIAIIVLNSNDRFGDTIKLYNWVKNSLSMP